MDVLGIDVGGVISDCKSKVNGAQLSNPTNYLSTPYIPGIVPVVTRLVQEKFGEQHSHIISKCGEPTQRRTMEVLRSRRFFDETGLPENHVHFCLKRGEKAPIALELGLTHFIDDKLEVLSYMVGWVPNLYLFQPNPEEVDEFQWYLPAVHVVNSADELAAVILG